MIYKTRYKNYRNSLNKSITYNLLLFMFNQNIYVIHKQYNGTEKQKEILVNI